MYPITLTPAQCQAGMIPLLIMRPICYRTDFQAVPSWQDTTAHYLVLSDRLLDKRIEESSGN